MVFLWNMYQPNYTAPQKDNTFSLHHNEYGSFSEAYNYQTARRHKRTTQLLYIIINMEFLWTYLPNYTAPQIDNTLALRHNK
jgi:hypothetical protein